MKHWKAVSNQLILNKTCQAHILVSSASKLWCVQISYSESCNSPSHVLV